MKFLTIEVSRKFLTVLLFTVLSLIIHSSYSQKHLEILKNSKTKDFNEIVRLTEEYYKNREKDEESGYTQFKVWEYFHRTRLDSNGKIINHTEKELREFKKYKSVQKENRYKTAAISQSNWNSLGPLTASYPAYMGRVSCIAVDPVDSNIIYVGAASGGLWKSTNRGSAWACITDGFPVMLAIAGIAIDPSSPPSNRRIYILTGDGDNRLFSGIGVLKSEDNGNSWIKTQTFDSGNDQYGHKLLMHPSDPKILFAATDDGIYKTIDGGLTWSLKLTNSEGVADIEFKPGAPNTMYAGTWNGIFRSTDLGETWTVVTTGLPEPSTFSRIALAVSPSNPSYVYALYGYYADNNRDSIYGFFRSTDSGISFNLRTRKDIVRGQGGYNLVLEASPINAEEVYGGGVLLFKSVNGGLAWDDFTFGEIHADNHSLQFVNKTMYSGTDGGIHYYSSKDGQWKDLSKGLVITQIYKIGADPNSSKILNGAQDNGNNKLIDKVNNYWAGGDGMECYVNPKNSNILYGSFQGGEFIKSEDDGSTYRGIGEGSYDQYRQWVTPFAMDPNNPDILYAGYEDLFRYNNLQSTWTNVTNGKIGTWDSSQVCNHICVAPSNSNYIYVVKWEGLYKSKDGGNTWASLFPGKVYDINYCVVHPTNPDIIFITKSYYNSGNKVFKSIDGGSTWQNISGTLPNISINCIEYQRGSNDGLYIGSDQGIYYRDNDLGDWILFNQGIPYTSVTELEIHYASQKIRAATYGRGVWESPIVGANIKPTVSITSPTNGQSFTAPASVAINATTTGTVIKVEFYQGDQKLGEDLTSPYSFTWTNIPGGVYTISAKAINSTDTIASTNSASINVTGGITCAATGSITRDFWANILGAEVYKIPVTTTPTSTSSLTIFEGPRNVADHYGSRIRGYVCAPLTGSYTFWIASDDQCELWLSTDENPANKKKIAYHTGWNFFREWEKYPTQKSVAITLTAGKRYYIEALQKEHELDDHVSVGWQIPGGIQERPIPGNRVSPFVITNNPPTVTLTSPGNNSTFTAPATFTITANASDSDGSITKVEFYQGSTLLGTDVSSPYNFNWSNVPIGTYYITAIAYDNSNNKTVSAYITVVVNPGRGMPIVSITSPTNNAAFNAPATITINANASDPGGAVTKVEFYQGSTLIGTDVSSPYSVVWSNVVVGTYYLTAVAYDNSNNHTVSQYITITVGVINKAPTVSLTAPLNNSSFSAPANITMNANASDSDGSIAKVEFYQGTTKLGEDATSPYSYSWTNVAVGNYAFTAKAFDNLGASTISSAVTISVIGVTSCTASGSILREFWNGVAGTAVSTVPVNLPPTSTSQASIFEGPSNVGSNYAARYRGYICVPVTGNYIFWISSNDASELWLGTNDSPANKVKIAFITGYTGIRQWDKYTTQKSATISLVAGQKYYIEALHKQGTGTDNLAVGWQLPNGTQERPIPGNRLSPYTGAIAIDKVEIVKLSAVSDTSALPFDITMYPNPIQKGNITLAVEGYEQTKHKVHISIVNQSGNIVYSDKLSCDITCRRTIINIDDKFQPGLYIVNVTIDKKVYSERLLVE